MSLVHALRILSATCGTKTLRSLENLSRLDIHVVTEHHAQSPMFNSDVLDIILPHFPKLKQLNVVFVREGATDSDKAIDVDTSAM